MTLIMSDLRRGSSLYLYFRLSSFEVGLAKDQDLNSVSCIRRGLPEARKSGSRESHLRESVWEATANSAIIM